MQNKWYDRLKWTNMIALPAFATAVLALDQVQDIGDGVKYAGVIVVVNTLLGALLVRSSATYDGAGDLVITTDKADGQVYLSADLNEHPEQFKDKQNVTLNIRRQDVAA